MADATLSTIAHFVRLMALGNPLVPEIPGVGILWFGQFSQYALLFFRSLLDPLVKLVPGGVFHILSFWREHSRPVFFLLGCCCLGLKHRVNLFAVAGRQRVGRVLCRSTDADQKENDKSQEEWEDPVCVHSM